MPGSTMSAASRFLSATDDEALNAFQLLSKLEGIIPALEPAHAIAKVLELAPKKPKDHLMVVNLSGRGDKDLATVAAHLQGEAAMTTRIDRRFAALKEEGRAALVTFVMGGDPDYETSLAIVKALPPRRRRSDRDRHAVHRSDGRRSGDPGRGLARAQRRAEHEAHAVAGARIPPRRRCDADRADGLLQSDLHLRRRSVSRRCQGAPASMA